MNLILALLSCLLPLAAGQDLLALNINAKNAPANALSTVVANAVTYIDILLNVATSDYIWLEPGEEVPDDRKLRADEPSSTEESDGHSVAATHSLRGGEDRELGMYSCPTTCAKSSSTSCKQLGCAYCGTRCRRRRQRARELLLSSGDAALIETTIDLLLLPLCFLRLGCSVKSELYRVTWVNGTTVQTPLT